MMTDTRGSTLMVTLVILTFLTGIGLSLVTVLHSRMTYATMQMERLEALYLAEAGIAKSIWELRYGVDVDGNGVGNIKETRLGKGHYHAAHDFQYATITAVGVVHDVKRSLQVKYRSI